MTKSFINVTCIPHLLQQSLGAAMIKAQAQLVELDLSDNAFGPNGVKGIVDLLKSKTCYTLKELRLNNNGLGTTGGKVGNLILLVNILPVKLILDNNRWQFQYDLKNSIFLW